MSDKSIKNDVKRPRSLFCRKLPVGNDKSSVNYRNQEYITESLLIALVIIVALRIIERYTPLMSGLYGAKYIIVNIIIDLALIGMSFGVLRVIYEASINKFNRFLDDKPELRESIMTEDAAELEAEYSCKVKADSSEQKETDNEEVKDNRSKVQNNDFMSFEEFSNKH